MNLTRIETTVDVQRLTQAKVTVVGTGASATVVRHLVRCGIQDIRLIDPDIVAPTNICRQDYDADSVGRPKVEALKQQLLRINPQTRVLALPLDFLAIPDADLDAVVGDSTLFIFATDRFAAQPRGNQLALRLNIPAIWLGMYAGALAGEIIFWHRDIDSCYRCLCKKRYEAQERAIHDGRPLDPPSDGCTIFDTTYVDCIAGHLALGLATRGSNDRFGRLITTLGNRNCIQVKLSPEWTFNGRDIVRDLLGIAADCENYFAWNAVTRRDADCAIPCPDCERFRSHSWMAVDGVPTRIRPNSV